MPDIIYHRPIPARDPRLKRNVRHDSRSRLFAYPTGSLSIVSATHARHIAVLDQGQVGSCTGNAGIGSMGTTPLFEALKDVVGGYNLDEPGAVKLYSDAESIDGDGPYPPNDNGSDGLSIAKALKNAGMISGYQHTFSLDACLKALGQTPVMLGMNWYDSMMSPAADGRLSISGNIAGGHEIEAREIDATNKRVWIDNSWGESWGVAGRAYLTFDDLGRLLGEQGDCTVLLPLSTPAPTPNPAPAPADESSKAFAAALRHNGWVDGRHSGENHKVAIAAQAWLKSQGL